MLELLLCSLLTIFPDYLYRRYVQGKRLGKEITFYSVWFELRWGITACLMLTIGLITVIFYYHPSTTRRHLLLPNRSDRSRDDRPRRRDPCWLERRGRPGTAALQAGQREARGSGGDRTPEDRGGRCRRWWSRGPISWRPRARSRRPGAPTSRRWTSWRPSRSCIRRNPGIVARRDIEKLQVAVEGRQAAIDCRHRREEQAAEAQVSHPAPGREGECRSCAGPGRSGSGEDHHPCRRRRTRGAIRSCAWATSSIR